MGCGLCRCGSFTTERVAPCGHFVCSACRVRRDADNDGSSSPVTLSPPGLDVLSCKHATCGRRIDGVITPSSQNSLNAHTASVAMLSDVVRAVKKIGGCARAVAPSI